jgi:iron(III) transport system substrate-binding protein
MSVRRRAVLTAPIGLAAARVARADNPAPVAVTDALIEAAKKEGKIAWYTADDLVLATNVSKGFEAKYGIKVQLERSGAERIYQRIAQEYGSGVTEADVATTSDLGHTVSWKANGWSAAYIPAEVGNWTPKAIGPDGTHIVDKFTLVISGYNNRIIKPDDAPKAWKDLLDPKWKGKLVKAHPGYSGAITNETYALSHLLGWEFYEALAKQNVLQVQSATDPPMRCAQGERAVIADGAEVTVLRLIKEGAPLTPVYPTEGVPVVGVGSIILAKSPRPNAARLFFHFMTSSECTKLNMDNGSRSFDPSVPEPASWTPTSKIKLLFNDPADLAREAEELKKRYTKTFGV